MLYSFFFDYIINCEQSFDWQVGFQIAASPIMEGIVKFHHDLMYIITIILGFTFYMLFKCLINFGFLKRNDDADEKKINKYSFHHAPILEIIWTIIPGLILIIISIPSYSLIYSMEEIINPLMTIRVIGHQWYWSYEIPSFNSFFGDFEININDFDENCFGEMSNEIENVSESKNVQEMEEPKNLVAPNLNDDVDNNIIFKDKKDALNAFVFWGEEKETNDMADYINDLIGEKDKDIYSFDSYMVPTDDLSFEDADKRLLKVDNELLVPIKTNIRFLVTSADVLHSWALPALGVKIDAVPGRLNEVYVYISRSARFYGQCSEICGVNHGFMPIVVNGIEVAGLGDNTDPFCNNNALIIEALISYFYKKRDEN